MGVRRPLREDRGAVGRDGAPGNVQLRNFLLGIEDILEIEAAFPAAARRRPALRDGEVVHRRLFLQAVAVEKLALRGEAAPPAAPPEIENAMEIERPTGVADGRAAVVEHIV
jgi:hypothetical protein